MTKSVCERDFVRRKKVKLVKLLDHVRLSIGKILKSFAVKVKWAGRGSLDMMFCYFGGENLIRLEMF